MTAEPDHHDSHDLDPRRRTPRDPGGGGRAQARSRSVFTSPLANVVFTAALAGCAVGVLAYTGRDVGAVAVAAVNALVLLMYVTFRRSFDRIEARALEGLVSWLIWTLLIGTATVFYAVDWRVLGAGVLAIVLLLSLANLYFVVMRPDVVDEWLRRADVREEHHRADDEDDRAGDRDDDFPNYSDDPDDHTPARPPTT